MTRKTSGLHTSSTVIIPSRPITTSKTTTITTTTSTTRQAVTRKRTTPRVTESSPPPALAGDLDSGEDVSEAVRGDLEPFVDMYEDVGAIGDHNGDLMDDRRVGNAKGDKGEPGLIGLLGKHGINGIPGQMGAIGPQGLPGEQVTPNLYFYPQNSYTKVESIYILG